MTPEVEGPSDVAPASTSSPPQGYQPMQSIDDWLATEAERDRLNLQQQIPNRPLQGNKRAAKAARQAQLRAEEQARKLKQEAKSKRSQEVSADDEYVESLDLSSNYIGRLLEYRAANTKQSGPVFTETSENTPNGMRYTCTVSIGELPDAFGASPRRILFRQKKLAKQYACKCAITSLILKNFMPASGGVAFPKVRPSPLPPKPLFSSSMDDTNVEAIGDSKQALSSAFPASSGLDGFNADSANSNTEPGVSFAFRVPQLCISLGMNTPIYVIESNPEFPIMYSGYAYFVGEPRVIGKVGQFTNIHGKKNAKEACAKELVSFLESIKEQQAALDNMARENAAAALKRKRDDENENPTEDEILSATSDGRRLSRSVERDPKPIG